MNQFVQAVIDGALIGMVYGLIAISFVVIYRASKIINLAQGEVLAFGALLLWTFTEGLATVGYRLPIGVALFLTLLSCFVFSMIVERIVFRPLIGQPAFTIFMAAIALLILLRGTAQLIWSTEIRGVPAILPTGSLTLGPFSINERLLVGAVFTLVITFALHWFFSRSRFGLRLAAVAEDHTVALSLGISVRQAITVAWVLGTVLATSAAVVLLSGGIISQDVANIGFRALPVALLGGLESVRGAPLAGLIIGLGEVLARTYLDPFTNGAASNTLPFVVMILVLFVRPEGLFGWKHIERL